MRNYDLKWKKSNPLTTLISILNNDLSDVREWLFEVLEKLPEDASALTAYIVLTGLRIVEACNSTKLIAKLSAENRVCEYLDSELMMLNHFKYPKLFLRNSKNVYISFISQDLLETILQYRPNLNDDDIASRLRKRGFNVRLKHLGKLHATILREHVPSEVIDLLHGRIGSSIFLRFYYKPFLQEIREKVMKALASLEREILDLL